jgi:hypothetical protein
MAPVSNAYEPIGDFEDAAAPRTLRRTVVAAGLVVLGLGAVAVSLPSSTVPVLSQLSYTKPDRFGPWAKTPGEGAKPMNEGYKRCGEGQMIEGCVPTPGPTAPSPKPSVVPIPTPTATPIVDTTVYYTYEELVEIADALLTSEEELLDLMSSVYNTSSESYGNNSAVSTYLLDDLIPMLEEDVIGNVTTEMEDIVDYEEEDSNSGGDYAPAPTTGVNATTSPTKSPVVCDGDGCDSEEENVDTTEDTEEIAEDTLTEYSAEDLEEDSEFLDLAYELADEIDSEASTTEEEAEDLTDVIDGISEMAERFEELYEEEEDEIDEEEEVESEIEEDADSASYDDEADEVAEELEEEQEEVSSVISEEEASVDYEVPTAAPTSASSTSKDGRKFKIVTRKRVVRRGLTARSDRFSGKNKDTDRKLRNRHERKLRKVRKH